MINHLRTALRSVGEIGNLALTCAFMLATLVFFAKTTSSISAGGGFARASDLSVGWVAMQAADPHLLHKALAWACAWAFGVAMIGCGWMSILGLRWSYHALLRSIKA